MIDTHRPVESSSFVSHPIVRGSAIVAIVLCASVSQGKVGMEIRALSGTDGPLGPDLGPGIDFLAFDQPVIGAGGQVAFGAVLTGTGVTGSDRRGVWRVTSNGEVTAVAREGVQGALGPGLGDSAVFIGFRQPFVNSRGEVAFLGDVPSIRGLWRADDQEGLTPLAAMGTDGPLGPGLGTGVTFDFLVGTFADDLPRFNDRGEIAFFARASTGETGIWASSGIPSALVRTRTDGKQGPGLGPAVTFSGFFGDFSFSPSGQLAFNALVEGVGVDFASDRGIWTASGTSGASLVARKGTDGVVGPGLGPGIEFSVFNFPRVNRAGDVAFFAMLQGDSLSSSDDRGLWIAKPGERPAILARSGTDGPLGPGLGPGNTFSIFKAPVLTGNGDVVFLANRNGPNGGIWRASTTDGIVPLALGGTEGAIGAELGLGISFDAVSNLISANARGDVVFEAFRGGRGGYWINKDGKNHPIIQQGELVDVDPTSGVDLRAVANETFNFGREISLAGGEDGLPNALNDRGAYAFRLVFTDGSQGIFTFQIPEPDSCFLAVLALLGLGFSGRVRALSCRNPEPRLQRSAT